MAAGRSIGGPGHSMSADDALGRCDVRQPRDETSRSIQLLQTLRTPARLLNPERVSGHLISRMMRVRQRCFVDLKPGEKNSILLVGDGRSGTTWVSNIINYNNEFRYMFEPFHPHFVDASRGFQMFQYLRPSSDARYFLNTARAVITGQFRHERVDQYNRRLLCTKRLIKDIFAHLFLKWLKVHFPHTRIILLLRHPCAIAVSKEKLRQNMWMDEPEKFLAQRELLEDFLHPFKDEIKAAKSYFEKQIINWCIIHHIVLKQFKEGEIHLAFYENFCARPEEEIRRLFSFLGKDFQGIPTEVLKRPSQMSRKESAINTGGSLIDEWRKEVGDEKVKRAHQILKAFQLESIYPDGNSLPDVAGTHCLLRRN